MTEEEYVRVTNIARLRHAEQLVSAVIISDNKVQEAQRATILRQLNSLTEKIVRRVDFTS